MSKPKHTALPFYAGKAKFSRNNRAAIEGTVMTIELPGAGHAALISMGAPQEEMQANAEFIARACNSHYELVEALKRFTRAPCSFDVLNPCFANRPEDAVGKHWGGGEACPECHASAAIAKAEQEAQS